VSQGVLFTFFSSPSLFFFLHLSGNLRLSFSPLIPCAIQRVWIVFIFFDFFPPDLCHLYAEGQSLVLSRKSWLVCVGRDLSSDLPPGTHFFCSQSLIFSFSFRKPLEECPLSSSLPVLDSMISYLSFWDPSNWGMNVNVSFTSAPLVAPEPFFCLKLSLGFRRPSPYHMSPLDVQEINYFSSSFFTASSLS